MKRVKRKDRSMAWLKREMDAVFSQYIRNKYSVNGICTCYTCGKKLPIKQMQNGHFISRGYLITRWNENNCRPQCAGCNIFGGGKPLDFEDHLKEELGDELVEEMKKSRHQITILSRVWYAEQIDIYKQKLKELNV